MKRWSRVPSRRVVPIFTAPRVVVVGHCASGKSTLVERLRMEGIDAVTAAQEHSAVPELWKHAGGELLVFLDVDLATVRRRRGGEWSEAIYSAQESRLQTARLSADLVIDTAIAPIEEVTARARSYVEWWRHFFRGSVESTA